MGTNRTCSRLHARVRATVAIAAAHESRERGSNRRDAFASLFNRGVSDIGVLMDACAILVCSLTPATSWAELPFSSQVTPHLAWSSERLSHVCSRVRAGTSRSCLHRRALNSINTTVRYGMVHWRSCSHSSASLFDSIRYITRIFNFISFSNIQSMILFNLY